jgi:ATP-binding cassette subfamily C protein CydC
LAALASFEIISNLSANSYHIQEIKTSIDRLSEIQEFQKESKELSFEPVSEIFPIKLENVSYSYQANDNFVLRNISIDIDQGEKIAIIGSNGSGKSTLTELLIGNRNDYSGDILFNGVERKKISDDSLRSKIIKLSAHPYFFNTTVRNNLLLAKKNATDDELRQVLAKVNLLNPPLIDLDSEIEEMGKNYSTGELQKLAFAQMLLQNGELLIFDEPFSNLDPVVTKIFFGYVEEFFKNKTIIFISHDYSHLDRFDKIYVMDHGKIVKKTGNSKG